MNKMLYIYVNIILVFITVPLTIAQNKIKIIKAEEVESVQPDDDLSGYCSIGCAMDWDLEVSSSLKPAKLNNYDRDKIQDGLVKTAWIEGKEDYGIDEFIIFSFPKIYFDAGGIKDSINLDGFQIVNGYCKSKKTYIENSRVKKIRMYLNSSAIFDIVINDSMTIQEITFEEPVYIKPNDEIKLEIKEVYEGKKYKDTAISELLPLGAH